MDFDDKSTQLEEVSIDKVCRTCLITSEELLVTLYDEDEQEKINFLEMLTVTFGKIVNRKIIFRFLRITTEPLNIF
jgi:hypothetical protein